MFKPPTPTLAVLVVEDEWLVRMEIADAFDEAGWTVAESSSGEAALALIQTGKRFDLLVTDIRLAGPLTGWDVADAFRTAHPQGAVVYASATPALESRRVPASAFVGKPFNGDELVQIAVELFRAGRTP